MNLWDEVDRQVDNSVMGEENTPFSSLISSWNVKGNEQFEMFKDRHTIGVAFSTIWRQRFVKVSDISIAKIPALEIFSAVNQFHDNQPINSKRRYLMK